MNYKAIISETIRDVLDERGIEITWSDTDAVAEVLVEVLEDVFDDAWRYGEVSK